MFLPSHSSANNTNKINSCLVLHYSAFVCDIKAWTFQKLCSKFFVSSTSLFLAKLSRIRKMCEVEAVSKIAKCLQVPLGQVKLNDEQVVTRTLNNTTVSGYATILNALAHESESDIAANSCHTREVEAQVYQWIEFAVLYVAPGSKDKHIAQQLLRDFNKLFLTKSYLVGHSITLADLAVFYAIYDLIKSLSPIDKESYLNLSRWFDHLQQRPEIRQGSKLLNFTTIYLHGWATGTHM